MARRKQDSVVWPAPTADDGGAGPPEGVRVPPGAEVGEGRDVVARLRLRAALNRASQADSGSPSRGSPSRGRPSRGRMLGGGVRGVVRWLVGPRAALAALVACALVAAGALLATWWFGRGMDDDGSLASEVGLASTGAWEVSGGAGSSGGGDVARLAGVGDGVRAGVPTSAQLAVHVAGAVSRPGLVRLWAGARVDDAVRSAGGVLPGADVGRVNLARRLNDGEQVYV
ncbi:MAG: SLBB domain-containing protein, partial [Micrococcales bacterium]|nr:SLBB domain-containing protein [Micrococcales bacterium]